MVPRLVGLHLLLVPLALVAGACGDNGGEKTAISAGDAVRPVETMTVSGVDATRVRSFSGQAQAGIETVLSFRVPGQIVELAVKIGSRVETGDLIARLDPTDFQLQLKEAEAGLAQARAAFDRAESDYDRARSLYEMGNIPTSELDKARAAFKSAEAGLEAARDRLGLAGQQLSYTRLTAPVAGSVAEVPADVHQMVDAGTPVALLTGRGMVQFSTSVSESVIRRIGMGQEARVEFESIPGRTFPARVVEVGVETRKLAAYPVKLELTDPDNSVLPGMIGEASFTLPVSGAGGRPGVIKVPSQAVASRPDGTRYVWVVDLDGNTVHSRDVVLAGIVSDGILIDSGLEPGETILVRGVHRVNQGQKVRLTTAPGRGDAEADGGAGRSGEEAGQ
jgi:RND family efflux transporter MFP subunit